MKKIQFTLIAVPVLIFGYASQGDIAEGKQVNEVNLQKDIQNAISTEIPVLLPNQLPYSNHKYKSAKTNSTAGFYEVVYYGLKSPAKVNSTTVKKAEKKDILLRIKGKKYKTEKLAQQQIHYKKFNARTGTPTKITSGLTAYRDSGAGTTWTKWNMGRWSLIVESTTKNRLLAVSTAQQMMRYLQKHQLIVPEKYGVMHINLKTKNTQIKWQKKTVVYEIDLVKSSSDALKAATSLK